MFSSEFRENFKNPFFTEHLRTAASENYIMLSRFYTNYYQILHEKSVVMMSKSIVER